MSKRDLFRNPFDEGTLIKLKILEDYFKEWLPVFIANPNPIWKEIQIFDLFAGEGKDVNNVPGSPQQCQEAGVAFFFKQWGGTNKKKAGRELGGRTYDEMPALTEPDFSVLANI
jgi:hypothetical protein